MRWSMAFAPGLAVITTPIRMSLGILIVVAVLIAILRHQLFDIDVLINRSLVYGALTVCVVAGYILVVGAVGTLFQTGDDLAVSLIATGLIAAAFAPARNRLQRLVNRLLYGYRNEPYQALTLLGRRLEATAAPDTVLPAVVTTVSDALKLPYVAIELGDDQVFVTAAEHGTRPSHDTDLLHLTLTQGGDDVGRLTLAARGHRDNLSASGSAALGGPRQADRRRSPGRPAGQRSATLPRTTGDGTRRRTTPSGSRPARRARTTAGQPDHEHRSRP